MRLVRTVVFPVPAPAMTSIGPWTCSMASRWRSSGSNARARRLGDEKWVLRQPLSRRISEKHEDFSEESLIAVPRAVIAVAAIGRRFSPQNRDCPGTPQSSPHPGRTCSSDSVQPPSGPNARAISPAGWVCRASFNVTCSSDSASTMRVPRASVIASFSFTAAKSPAVTARRDCSEAWRARRCQRSTRFCRGLGQMEPRCAGQSLERCGRRPVPHTSRSPIPCDRT